MKLNKNTLLGFIIATFIIGIIFYAVTNNYNMMLTTSYTLFLVYLSFD
jgi:hypothetical protein